jgi:site-specific DNA-methyltransferase (adenine-specific)
MTPYYEDGTVTIYHGDCREVLPDLSADVVLTDPPYAIGVDYGAYDDTDANLNALLDEVLPLIFAVADRVLITPGVGNLWRYPEPKWVLCWFDPGGTGSGPWGFCTWQPVLAYGTDPYLAAGKGRRPDGRQFMLGRRPHKEDKDGSGGHPCPKPLDVMSWLVSRSAVAPATFVDPFMGSGSTLRAAKNHGHQAIGIEIDERYCEIAAKRMGQGVLELTA